jgi:four helix bundle protein
MPRDYKKLRVFELADRFVFAVYQATRAFPPDERFGLTAQLRRAAVSVAANIVESCFRDGEREYVHFLEIALGSCGESGYLLDLSHRLGYLDPAAAGRLCEAQDHCIRSLVALVRARRLAASQRGHPTLSPTASHGGPNAERRTPNAASPTPARAAG